MLRIAHLDEQWCVFLVVGGHVPNFVSARFSCLESFFACVDTLLVLPFVEMHLGFQSVTECLVGAETVEGAVGQVVDGGVDVFLDEVVGVAHRLLYAFFFNRLKHFFAYYDTVVGVSCGGVVGWGESVDKEEVVVGAHNPALCQSRLLVCLIAFGVGNAVDEGVVSCDAVVAVIVERTLNGVGCTVVVFVPKESRRP